MIFLGCLFDRKDEKSILDNNKGGLSNAANTFQWNLIDGINEISEKPIDIVNVLPVGTFPKNYNKLFLETKKWSYGASDNTEIGSINLPFLKQFIREKKVKNLIRKKGDKNIIIYSAYLPFLRAVRRLDKSYNISLIVTDLPEFYDLGKTSGFRKMLRKGNNKLIYKCLKRIDSFVLLTEQMRKPLKVGERPYVVVEGIAKTLQMAVNLPQQGKRVVFYAGTLHYQFGIKTLLEAFEMIDDENYELWICGNGDAEEEIKALAQKDSRVKFYGYLTKTDVARYQSRATVLVNPRTNEGEYTKYSFPSKTMEYLAAGKPVIMHKLDGIPDEYDEYLYYINGPSAEDLKDAITKACSKTDDELALFGAKASKWVLKEKSPAGQAKKIIRMMENERI